MTASQLFDTQAKRLIDDLKSVCANYGLGNDGNEFKIITQIFLYKFLNDKFADEAISQNSQLLKNEEFAERELLRLAITQFNKTHGFGFDAASLKDINKTILKEYLDEASGKVPA